MQRFREHILSRIITVVTAVLFLNMSFFLAEINFLELEKDGRFTKIIALIVSGTCFEEEKEVGGDGGEEGPTKKIDVVFHYLDHSGDQYILLSEVRWVRNQAGLLSQSFETATPPPEF